MRRRVLGSAIAVVTLGTLLHFAWEWSGRSALVALVAAVNESTWEHLKLAFWPALLLAPILRYLYRASPGWLAATAVRALLPCVLIAVLFYAYTSILHTHHLALDIGVFVVAVLCGEIAGHPLMVRHTTAGVRVAAAAALLVAVAAFATFSFRPPSWFLFADPVEARGAPGAQR